MQKTFILLLLALCFQFQSTVQADNGQINVYLCARLSPAAREWNALVADHLGNRFNVFLPQDIDLSQATDVEFDKQAYDGCLVGMVESDILLVLPAYGRDCAWEIGWFCGQGKPAFAYVEQAGDWMRDAMVKGGLTAIFTNNEELYHQLQNDAATINKSYLIESREGLENTLFEYCSKSMKVEI